MAVVRCIVTLLALASPVSAAVFRSETKTCPSTSFHTSTMKDAVGAPAWGEMTLTEGECNEVTTKWPKDGKFKICGPGTFTISALTCQKHEYKAKTISHPDTEYTVSTCGTYDVKDYYGDIASVVYKC